MIDVNHNARVLSPSYLGRKNDKKGKTSSAATAAINAGAVVIVLKTSPKHVMITPNRTSSSWGNDTLAVTNLSTFNVRFDTDIPNNHVTIKYINVDVTIAQNIPVGILLRGFFN